VAVRHGGRHVHVLAGRVNAFGKVWRENPDYARAMAAVRVIERDPLAARSDRVTFTVHAPAPTVDVPVEPDRSPLPDPVKGIARCEGATVAGCFAGGLAFARIGHTHYHESEPYLSEENR
jgi:hypothetical protein